MHIYRPNIGWIFLGMSVARKRRIKVGKEIGGIRIYTLGWRDNSKFGFPRGYHIEISGGMRLPSYCFGFDANVFNEFFGLTVGGYEVVLREDVKKYYCSVHRLSGREEGMARKENYC